MDKNIIGKYLAKILKKTFKFNYENLYFDYLPIYQEAYRDIIKYIDDNNLYNNIKTIIANDVFMLPIADRLKRYIQKKYKQTIPLIGDMHEIHFDYNSQNLFNQTLRKWLCLEYLRKLVFVSVASNQGANLYKQKYQLKNVIGIVNAPNYEELSFNHNPNKIKLVHVGGAGKERKLEKMIEAMSLLDSKFLLYFHLTTTHSNSAFRYLNNLKEIIAELNLKDRVFIEEPIEPDKLVEYMNRYDIGVLYLKPKMQNHKYALPNKFFQYIQARLGVVVSDIGEMPKYVEEYDIGIIPEDFELETYVKAINNVADNLKYYKDQSNKAAKILNAKNEWIKLVDFIEAL